MANGLRAKDCERRALADIIIRNKKSPPIRETFFVSYSKSYTSMRLLMVG